MASRFAPVASLALGLFAACGPTATTVSDAGRDAVSPVQCTTPCACADRGPPNYSQESTGTNALGADAAQQAALLRANHWRTAAGIAALTSNGAIQQAAMAHATYLAGNPQSTCWPNPHVESSACSGFTGAAMSDRMSAAGYQWSRASEVINWESTSDAAIDGWIWTVYHRLPLLDWQFPDTGFGHVPGTLGGRAVTHSVMDFGLARNVRPSAPPTFARFPVPGQTAVPPGFRGDLEGPQPPAPGGAATWPRGLEAGTVVSLHFQSATWSVATHQLFNNPNGACAEVPHTFISRNNDPNLSRGLPSDSVLFYADVRLQPQTEYVARLTGSMNGQAFDTAWAFTTQ